MKCGLDRFRNVFKFFWLKFLIIYSAFNLCILAGESKQSSDLLADFDYLVSQLYLQHCTFVEIGEGICSLFVELALDSGGRRPLRRQMFFGNCLCSEFRRWHLCSRPLTRLRREDCEFQEGTSCPSSNARVHRRLCDVTGMSQWNPQCNCSVPLAGAAQQYLCGFKTCYAAPLPATICGPRTVCGTAHCDVGEHGSLYSVRCDRRCRNHRPFCEDPCPPTSLKRSVTSQWAEWRSSSPSGGECNMKQFETECLNDNCNKEDSDCICEVKMQDGKLKAFRYLIKFTDEQNQCDNNAKFHSKLKVRSIKGDAKVWDRFIGAASREDKDSISMFGKPVGFEAYLSSRRNRPEALKEISAGSMEASLQNSANPKQGILQNLVSMVSNRSQLAEKPTEKPNISDKTVQGTNITSNSSDDKSKLVDQGGKQTAANQTLDSTKPGSPSDKQQVNANSNQVQIISNNSNSNSNLTGENPKSNLIQTGQNTNSNLNLTGQNTNNNLNFTGQNTNSNLNLTGQNQQNNAKQTDKLSEEGHYHYHFTPLPYLNMSMTPMSNTETVKQNNSDLQKIVNMVRKVTHNLDEEIVNDVKTFKARSQIYKMISENENIEQLNSSMGTLAQSNRGKELFQANIVGHKEVSNNSGISTDAALDPDRENVNRLIRFLTSSMKAQSPNENIKDKIMGSQLKTNAANEIMKSSLQTKEIKKSKERLKGSNLPKVSIKQEDIKNKERLEGENYNDKQGERMVLGIGGKRDKIKNKAKQTAEGKGIGTETKLNGEEKHIETDAEHTGKEKYIETESKLTGEETNIKTVAKQTGNKKYIETESKLTGKEKSLKTGAKRTGEEKVVETVAKQNGEGKTMKIVDKQTGEEKGIEIESKLNGEETSLKAGAKKTGEEKFVETEAKQNGEGKDMKTAAKQKGEEKYKETESKLNGEENNMKTVAKQTGEDKDKETESKLIGEEKSMKMVAKQIGEEKDIETESKLTGEEKNMKTVAKQTGEEKDKETEPKLTGEEKNMKTVAKQTGQEKYIETESKLTGEEKNMKTVAKQTGEEKDIETESKLTGEEEKLKTVAKQTGEENNIETESTQTGEDKFVETEAKQTHEEKGTETETKQNGEKDKIEEDKINIDKIVENQLRGNEKNEHVDSKQEFPLRSILMGENDAKDQEVNLAEEQKAELTENGNLQEDIPVQGEQKDYEQLKEDEEQSLYSNRTSKVINQNVKNQDVKSKVEEQSLYSMLTTREIYQNVKKQKDYEQLREDEEQSLYSNRTSKVINQNANNQGVKSKVEEQSLYSMLTTKGIHQNVKNRGVKSKRVKKHVTPELMNHNSKPKLELGHQQRVIPVQGNQKDNLNGNKEIKNYESSKQINEVFTHKQGQSVTSQLVFKDSTPKLIHQNLTPKPTDQDFKKQQGVISAIGKQKENEHANKDITHYVTNKPVNKDYTLNLKSQVATSKVVNKVVTPKLINQDLTPKLIDQDNKSQQGATQTKKQNNNEQANKGINPYVTSKLKSQDDKAMLVNKDITPQLINHNMTPKLFNQDIRNQKVVTPVKGKQDVNENEDLKHRVTPKIMNEDFTPKLKNQDVTTKLINKDVTTKLKSQNLIPKLMNPDLKTLGSGVTTQSNPKNNEQGNREIKYSVTPKIRNENITPKLINKDLKTQQGVTPAQGNQKNNNPGNQELKNSVTPNLKNENITPKLMNKDLKIQQSVIPAQSKQKNNDQGNQEQQKSVTPNLINENITPKLMNKDLKIQEGVIPTQSQQKNNGQGKPEMKQSVTSKLVNEDITPKITNQGVTPKPINQDITPKKIEQKYYPKPIDQEFTPKHISQDFTPKEVAPKVINQDFTPKLKHQNDDTKVSSNSKVSSRSTVNSQPTKIFVSENIIKGSSSAIANKPTTPLSYTEQTNKKSLAESDKITTKGLQNDDDGVEIIKTNYGDSERKVVEQGSQKSLSTGTQTSTNITQNNNTAVNSNLTAGKSIKLQVLDTKVKYNDIADIFPTINLDEVTMPPMPTKRRSRPIFLQDDDDNAIKLEVKSMTTPDILSAIAKKLFNSRSENSLNDPNDPIRMLSESNPSIELPEEKCSDVKCYDDPEPVLCDLSKVDRDNLDEKMCDALDQVAGLKLAGKVDWLEKPEIFNNERDLDKEKKTGGKENKHTLRNKPKLSAEDFKEKKIEE